MISIIIPTLNEEEHLPATLKVIQANPVPHEVIVSDSGSSDGTVLLAQQAGARVVTSLRRQRAAQMNLGAAQARGEVLLFLHADTRLPPIALARVEQVMRRPGVAGGAFARRFENRSLFLLCTCWLAEIRNRLFGWHLGDQAIFIRRELFDQLGGFRDIDLFEDLDLSRRMKRLGRVATLNPPVVSSARRFERYGPVATTLSDLSLTFRYLRGVDPNVLAAELRRSAGGRVKISVIIPTLNEESALPNLLAQLADSPDEIIVVDGESTDRTTAVARSFPVKLITSPRGRAVQMNTGAAFATGNLLWFLHADTTLPLDWRDQLLHAGRDHRVGGGGFRVVINGRGLRYRFLDAWGFSRTLVQRSFYGDQGIFVRRDVFQALGGFSLCPVLEDLDFSTSLSRQGRVRILSGPLKTSARRWESEGWWRTVQQHTRLALRYLFDPASCRQIPIVVMAKVPLPGEVKTRLIPSLSPEQAAQLARRLLKETVALVQGLAGVLPMVAVSPPDGIGQMRQILEGPVRFIPQTDGDFGFRLIHVFSQLFREGARGVIVLGSDHPNLPADYLSKAVRALQRGKDEVVLGPTEDGGYYLMGLNHLHPELFQEISWSTSKVLDETRDHARAAGLKVTLLPSWYDIDRPEDLARLQRA